MIIFAIETSCDETAVSVIKGDQKTKKIDVLSEFVSSQVEIHAKWGGVVPNLAAREHLKNIELLAKKALCQANVSWKDIELFAVTHGPGLIPALLIGTNFAKALSYFSQKQLVGIHHIEGHISASLVGKEEKLEEKNLALVVSGGHTQLVLINKFPNYEIIGQTQDDAVGEAFDKVAKILDLGYPGGPIVSKKAAEFRGKTVSLTENQKELLEIQFPRPMLNKKNFDFSFSGIKTSVLYFWEKNKKKHQDCLPLFKEAICYAFEEAVVDVLTQKTMRALKETGAKNLILAGGVAANQRLRKSLEKTLQNAFLEVEFLPAPIALCGDNATMIAAAAFWRFLEIENNPKEMAKLNSNWKNLEAKSSMALE